MTEPTSRILIADDNQQNCELLEAFLADENYSVEMVGDGQATLEKVAEWQPDLILLDIMMPKLSGYEVCQRLKKDESSKNIPVLMVTALNEMGDIEKAVAAGCDDFLTKPVHRLSLTTRVRSLLRVRHLENERDRLLAYLEQVDEGFRKNGLTDDDDSDDDDSDDDDSDDDDSDDDDSDGDDSDHDDSDHT